MPDLVLAHAGHWLSGLIYLAPVALIVAFLGVQQIRMRRHPDRYGPERFDEPTLDEIMDAKERLR
jgi:hypothetical protein